MTGPKPPRSPAGRERVRALFVDRDGTLVPDFHYLADPARLEVYRGVGEALRLAHDHGYEIVCVTNQSGIERGLYTREIVDAIHHRLNELLARSGARINAFYYCPHAPETGCKCRKPETELFERARTDRRIDFAASAIIGDRWVDVEAGRRLGLLTVLVPPIGHEAEVLAEMTEHKLVPDIHVSSFRDAVARVLARG
ncbi:MAG: HAD family hydrolase [Thermoplasmata archaeon]